MCKPLHCYPTSHRMPLNLMHGAGPRLLQVLDALLSKLADAMAEYIKYQIRAGAQCVQIFDSWGGQLPPREWEK